MIHVWGHPPESAADERICAEPLTKGTQVTYHPRFLMLAGGEFVCLHCGEKFTQPRSEAEEITSEHRL